MSVEIEKEKRKKVAPKKKKEKPPPEPYWNQMVDVFFSFCKDKFGDAPTFDGSAPRDLKQILITLRQRAEIKGVDWTEEAAKFRFVEFLKVAYSDSWLSQNFILFNINRQKDRLFFKQKNNNNGRTNTYWQNIGIGRVEGSTEETPL